MNTPRLIEQHPDAVETLGGQWGVLGCIAWIASRDAALVAAVQEEEGRWAGGEFEEITAVTATDLVDDLKADLRHYYCGHDEECSCFVSACEQLVARASTGALSPAGVRDGEAAPAKIDAWEFNSPGAFIACDGYRLLAHVGRLQFAGREIVDRWPGDVSRLQFLLKDGIRQVSSTVASHAPVRRTVEKEEFRSWVAACIEEGHNQTWIARNACAAFPQKIVPGREKVRQIQREEHRRIKGFDPRPGKAVA